MREVLILVTLLQCSLHCTHVVSETYFAGKVPAQAVLTELTSSAFAQDGLDHTCTDASDGLSVYHTISMHADGQYVDLLTDSTSRSTVNFANNGIRRGIRKMSLFAKCPYNRSPI